MSVGTNRRGFTLVELLVVIGIIALLISILLPALMAARRQAAAVKCAAHLREIGKAFFMYSQEQRGYFPPAQLVALAPGYNLEGRDWIGAVDGVGVYWTTFLQKYLTKTKQGIGATTAAEADAARKTVLWGCPAWDGYRTTAIGGVNRVQTGLGMNIWPTFTSSYPASGFPADTEQVFIQNWNPTGNGITGRFIKQNVWGRMGSRRCLVTDSLFWMAQSQAVPANKQMAGQAMLLNNTAAGNHAFGAANTLVDAYRHGKYPKASNTGYSYLPQGGKIAFNVLYCDGHVATSVDRSEAFSSIRMRFPG